jgi:hypothetical protein
VLYMNLVTGFAGCNEISLRAKLVPSWVPMSNGKSGTCADVIQVLFWHSGNECNPTNQSGDGNKKETMDNIGVELETLSV